MKRYEFYDSGVCGERSANRCELREDGNGDWVTYNEHIKIVAELGAKLEEANKAILMLSKASTEIKKENSEVYKQHRESYARVHDLSNNLNERQLAHRCTGWNAILKPYPRILCSGCNPHRVNNDEYSVGQLCDMINELETKLKKTTQDVENRVKESMETVSREKHLSMMWENTARKYQTQLEDEKRAFALDREEMKKSLAERKKERDELYSKKHPDIKEQPKKLIKPFDIVTHRNGQHHLYGDSVYVYEIAYLSDVPSDDIWEFCQTLRKAQHRDDSAIHNGSCKFPYGLDSFGSLYRPNPISAPFTWKYSVTEPYTD